MSLAPIGSRRTPPLPSLLPFSFEVVDGERCSDLSHHGLRVQQLEAIAYPDWGGRKFRDWRLWAEKNKEALLFLRLYPAQLPRRATMYTARNSGEQFLNTPPVEKGPPSSPPFYCCFVRKGLVSAKFFVGQNFERAETTQSCQHYLGSSFNLEKTSHQ